VGRALRVPAPSRSAKGRPLLLIAGPCVIESEQATLAAARLVAEAGQKHGLAHRLQVQLRQGEPHFGKKLSRPPACRRFANPIESEGAVWASSLDRRARRRISARRRAEVVDVLQIPAFLCRPDRSAGRGGAHRPAGQRQEGPVPAAGGHCATPSPSFSRWAAKTCSSPSGASTFGYGNHGGRHGAGSRRCGTTRPSASTRPTRCRGPSAGAGGATTGATGPWRPPWLERRPAVGIDALFCEVHEDPDRALSDGPNFAHLPDVEPRWSPTCSAIRSRARSLIFSRALR